MINGDGSSERFPGEMHPLHRERFSPSIDLLERPFSAIYGRFELSSNVGRRVGARTAMAGTAPELFTKRAVNRNNNSGLRKKVKSSMARSLPVKNLLLQNVWSIINDLQ